MGDITRDMMNRFRRARIRARRYTAGFLATATLVGCGVGWSLRQTGISATADTFCGAEEHTHTQQCYEKALVCGMEEGETLPTEAPHAHEESCYGLQKVCVCGTEAHAHSDACYAMQRNLTCTSGEHSHGDACYTTSGGELTCAAAEHTHSDECKDAEGNKTCDQQEHSHGDGCFSPVERTLSCTLTEHTHDDSCYGDAEKVLICGHGEHEHTDACYEEQQVLVCTLSTEPEAQTPHVHSEACYEERRICGKEEHSHTDQCLSDPTADVEDADAWSANACNPGSGVWAADLLGVASAQLGYAESQRNFRVDENGIRRGYTRYGAWYGDPYGSWNGMFLAYCLHFAGVPESAVSQRAGVSALLADLSGSDRLKNPDDYTPQPGDIAVFGDRVGVIREAGETLTVICGDVDGKVAELSVAPSGVSRYVQVANAAVTRRVSLTTYAASTQETISLNNDHDLTVTLKNRDGDTTTIPSPAGNPSFAVNDGEAIGLEISFTIINGELTQEKYIATYQIPDGVKPQVINDGKVYESDVQVGTFVIDDNGLITITFNDNAINASGNQYGTLRFEGTAKIGEEQKTNGITFDGAGTTTIEKREDQKNPDFSVQKVSNDTNFRLSDDAQYAEMDYTVTISSQNGSGDLVLDITDTLNKGVQDYESEKALTGAYKEGSFALKKGDQEISFNPEGGPMLAFSTNDGKPQFTVNNLGKLEAGESYTLTYTVQVPVNEINSKKDSFLRNAVAHHDNQEYFRDVSVNKLGKNGALSGDKKTITWTITINSAYGDVSGYQIWDALPQELTLQGDLRIVDSTGQTTTLSGDAATDFFYSNKGYIFAEGSSHPPYTITYVTDTGPQDGTSHEYTNSVSLKEDESVFNAESKVTYNPNDWQTTKERLTSTPSDDSPDVLTWKLSAVNSQSSKNFDIEEYLTAYETGSWNMANADRHYIQKADLLEDLKKLTVKLSDGSTVTYENPDNKVKFTPVYTADDQGRITSFQIHVEALNEALLINEVMLDSYRSHFVAAGIAEGGSCEYKNTAKVGGRDGSASYTYTNFPAFKKSVTTNPYDPSKPTSAELKNVSDGCLWYKIQLSVDENQSYPITIMDRPPENAEFTASEWAEKFVTDLPLTHQMEEGTDEKGRYLLITIDKESADSVIPKDGLMHGITLEYRLRISNDPRWKEDLRTSVTYVNSAEWVGTAYYDSCEATVTQFNTDTLVKESVQCVDSEGKKINEVQYTILINPAKKDLDNTVDTLTLTDTLTLPDGVTAQIVYGSIELYNYGGSGPGNKLILDGDPLECSPVYSDERPHTFSLTILDKHAYVLRYRVKITDFNPGTNTIRISNMAQLGSNMSSAKEYYMETVKYSADLVSSDFTIVKQDPEGKRLKGAKFVVEIYNPETDHWDLAFANDLAVDEFTTISVAQNPSDGKIGVNRLYRISESAAPSGYTRDATPRYILFYTTSETAGFTTATAGRDNVLYGTEELTQAGGKIIFRSARVDYTLFFTNVESVYTYELPNTGGAGTKNYVLFGTLAMILAGCGYVVTRKKRYTGVYER